MKMSRMFMPTLREVPSDAEITSHQLMLRAGMIKKMSSGVYNQLPMGLRVFNKIQKIVREELENKGCQEILCAGIIPAELWKESGRWDVMGAEMFRLQDRNERDFCLGPTHEEVFTDIIRQEVTSYKQLPLNLYQIQVKYRDERRPRFGVMRTKTFTMKDGYSFDVDQEGLDKSYQDMFDAYTNIFARCGLENSPVQADTGAIGGSVSAEFMVKSEVGEDEIVFCSSCDYAANMEKAVGVESQGSNEDMLANEEIHTPGIKSIEELQEFTKYPMHKLAKTLVYVVDGKTVVVILRGDRELNEVKMGNAIGGAVEIEMADASVIESIFNADAGSLGPINIKPDYLLIDQEVAVEKNVVVGANKTDYHILNVNFGRDFDGMVGDFKNVTESDKCTKCGNHFEIARGVEVGHIFKLGTKYSEAMGANFIDKDGKSKPMVMGCYGIGIERTAASIVEQHHDENGISWPLAVAPYHVVVIPVNIKKEEHMEAAEKIYNELAAMGVEVLLDDRDERAGVKFKDSELIGIPMRVTVGKDIVDGKVEFKLRKEDEKQVITLDEIKERVVAEFTKNEVKLG